MSRLYLDRERIHRRASRLLALAAAPMLVAGVSADVNQIANWTNGGGDRLWSNPLNWSPSTVPANSGTSLFNVIVPNNSGLIHFDLATPTSISGISFGSGSTLSISGGRQLTVDEVAVIRSDLVATGTNTLYSATSIGASLGDNVRLLVSDGATVRQRSTSYYNDRNLGSGGTEVVALASGAASLLDLSKLQTITLGRYGGSRGIGPIWRAFDGGVIDLSGLQSISGGDNSFSASRAYFRVYPGSNIKLDSLRTLDYFTDFTIQVPTYAMPSLETAEGWIVALSSGTQMSTPALTQVASSAADGAIPSSLTIPESARWDAPNLLTLNDTTLNLATSGTFSAAQLRTLRNTYFEAAPGKTFIHGAISNFDNSRLLASGGASIGVVATSYSNNRNLGGGGTEVVAQASGPGSLVDLASVQTITLGRYGGSRGIGPVWRATAGGVVDLSGLQSISGGDNSYSASRAYFRIDPGSDIKLTSLKTLTYFSDFNIQASSYALPALETAEGWTVALAVGTQMSTPVMTQIASSGADGEIPASLTIPEFASWDAPQLRMLNDATLNVSIGGGFVAPQLQTMRNSYYEAVPGKTFTHAPITSFDNSRLLASGGASIGVAATSYYNSRNLGSGGTEVVAQASGPGSLVDLSNVQTITLGRFGGSRGIGPVWRAAGGGVVDLSGLQVISGGDNSYSASRAYFRVDPGGVMKFGNVSTLYHTDLALDGSSARLEAAGLSLGSDTRLKMTNLATLRIARDFAFASTDETITNFDTGIFQFNGDGMQNLEAGGRDGGTGQAAFNNFGLQQLIVGQPGVATTLRLRDEVDNGNRQGSVEEALYTLDVSGQGLRILSGSTLVLDDLNMYVVVGGAFKDVRSFFAPGQNLVPYDGGYIAKSLTSLASGWKVDANGDWSTDTNWNLASPNGLGAAAYFGNVLTAGRVVNLDLPKTVGFIGFECPFLYSLQGSGTLTLAASGNVQIEVTDGTHEIAAPLRFSGNGVINVLPTDSILTIFNPSAASGVKLTKDGAGTLAMKPIPAVEMTVSAGTLQMTAAGGNPGVGSASFVSLNLSSSATFDLATYDQSLKKLTGAGSIMLGNGTLTMINSEPLQYAGIISGPGHLVQQGAGTLGVLTLTGANTYSGQTIVHSGTLQCGAANAASPSSPVTIDAGGVLDLNSLNQSIPSLSGAGSVRYGASTLTLSGTASTNFAGALLNTGTSALVKSGAGTQVLSNESPFSGRTTISAGQIVLAHQLALQNSTVSVGVNNGLSLGGLANATIGGLLGAGSLELGTTALSVGNNGESTSYSGVISGGGRLIKIGAGSLSLGTGNLHTGGTDANGGLLVINADNRLGATTGSLSFDGGGISFAAAFNLAGTRPVVINAGGGTIDTQSRAITLSQGITAGSGKGVLTKTGSGTLTLSGPNAHGGGTAIAAGTLVVASDSNLGAAGATLTLSGGTLRSTGSFSSTRSVNLSGMGGAIDTNGNDVTFGPADAAAGTLTKTSAGQVTLRRMRVPAVVLNAGGIRIASGGGVDSVSNMRSFSIAGAFNNWNGSLDLTDSAMLVDYTGASPLITLRNQVIAGFAVGQWTGNGIRSSAAASNSQLAIGYVEASEKFASFPAGFLGQSADSTTVLLRVTLAGDADLSGGVDSLDFARLVGGYGTVDGSATWGQGDFDYNGKVNTLDFNRLAGNFGQTLPAAGELPAPSLGSIVPEPALVSLIPVSLLVLRRTRR